MCLKKDQFEHFLSLLSNWTKYGEVTVIHSAIGDVFWALNPTGFYCILSGGSLT